MRTKRFLSILLSLVLVLGMLPGMSLTASAADSPTEITPSNTSGMMTITLTIAAAQTEELLTTITATGKEQASYNPENVATVSFSYSSGGSSAYLANWGWWGYGWTATVNAAEGYTITKCVFYDDANRTATDSEAPFVVETTEEDKTPRINGTPIDGGNFQSKGLKKIEVYGYATPASSYSVTITPGDHMTKTANSGETSQTDLSGAMTAVVYTADDGYYFPTDYSVAEVSGIKVTRDSYTQITVSGTPSADATITLTAPTAKTTPDAPATASATGCTTSDNNDGKLTGVTTAMEYKKSDADSWTAGTGNDITGLVPGTYYVRVKATDTANASANQELTIADYNTAAANTVSNTISALPAAADVTLDNAQAVADAKAAYDALTDGQKALVPADTVNKLNAAVAKIADLTAANTVSNTISALPDFSNVTTANKDAIEAARTAYNALTNDQKALVSADTLKKLTDAEDKLVIIQVMSEVSAKTGSDMTYTGNPIQLINTPTTALPAGYTMKYAVTTENTAPTDESLYATSIPEKTDEGTYYVWYKVIGDENHNNTEPACVTAAIRNTYEISFDANGGNSGSVPDPVTKTHGKALTLPTQKPTHASTRTVNTISFDANGGQCETRSLSSNMYYTYSFREWNTKANGTGEKYAPGGSYNEDAEATLYARWSLGISITPITLPTPTREGYTFKGWATTKGAVSGVTGTYTPSYSHTLYAVWQINKYTISFDTAGGSELAPITQDYGTAIKRPADPTREGYSFAGWSETIPWTMPAKDMEVTAQWTVNQYSVRYDKNGGTGTMTDLTSPYDYESEVTALENGFTAPANRSFGGWNTEADGTGTAIAAGDLFTLTGNTTLYAQWNKRKPACFTSLNLADGFDLRFYVSGMDDYEGLTISWTGKDGQPKDSRPVNSVDPVTSGSITAYGFVLESFTAREMTQSAHVTITDADGEILTEVDCSVKSYCDQALKTGSATLKALSQAVLDYGTYTQRYFKYNTENLPNPEADGADLPAVPAAFDYTVQGSSKGVKGTNITLALSDRTALNFYFTLESESYTAASYTVTVKNAAGAAVQPNINVVNSHGVRALQVMITGISAKDLGKMWDVTLRSVEDGSEIVFHGSPLSYAYRSQDDAELGNTVKGLYNYYLKADEFFRSR